MRIWALFLTIVLTSSTVFAGAAITFHGRILDPQGNANTGNVTFKIQVRSPGVPNCLLYEETRSVVVDEGVFVIPIGDGNGQRSSQDPGITIEKVFSNDPSQNFTSLHCNSGSAYVPAALDSRRLVVSFNDGSGAGDQALPSIDVNYVPFALHAEEATNALKIGGVDVSRVMTVASGAVTALTSGQFSELLALVNGTSSVYLKSAALPSCASGEVLKATGGNFVCVTDASGTDTLAGISCIDGKILKRVAGSWACADESGVGTENDPTVQAYAKRAPGTGLAVNGSNDLVADFGTGAGKIAQGNDSRFTDSRTPTGAASGDLSGSYPNPLVKAIRGNQVATTTPLDGQVYQWISGSTEWQPKYVSFADLKKSDGTAQMPASCAANQTLAWSAITDVFTCAAIGSLDASKITTGTIAYARLPVGTAASTVAAGDDARFGNALKVAGTNINVSSLASGQVLKFDGTNWVNAADSGVGSEVDPTVAAYAKNAPATGLIVNGSNKIAPDFGTGAGKVVEGNDSRLSDTRVASDINGVVSTGILQRTGAGSFSTLGVAAPVTNSAGNIGLAVGAGLTLSSGSLVPDFGTASGKVAQGNDSRFPSSTCASGNKMRWDGSAWQCETDASTDSTKVLKSGDTMTGALNLPTNGLVAGTTQLVLNSGNVGIGTASPTVKLDVAGPIRSNTATPYFLAESSTANQGYFRMVASSGTNYIQSGLTGTAGSAADLKFTDTFGSNDWMTIKATGNVGIGTSAPGAKLHVSGTSGLAVGAALTGDNAVSPAAAGIVLSGANQPGPSTYTSPGNSTTIGALAYYADSNDSYKRYFDIAAMGSTGGAPANIRFLTGSSSATERLRIDGSGRVGIGTATPTVALDVNGALRAGSSASVTTCGSGAANGEGSQRYNYTTHAMEYCNGTTWLSVSGGGSSTLPTRQVLTSGTTYTSPASVRQLRIRMVGGGGGGGGYPTSAGGTGGTTSFGSFTAVGGGGGGIWTSSGAAGGPGGTGGTGSASIRITGASGGDASNTGNNISCGNGGGNSPFGGAPGSNVGYYHVNGVSAPANSGSGGSGGASGGYCGGGGGAGEYVELIINSPAATYSYSIGAGGTAGTGGTNNGGAGGSGLIVVDEFY